MTKKSSIMVKNKKGNKKNVKYQVPQLFKKGNINVPDIKESSSLIWAHDRKVQVLFQMNDPRVIVFGNFLSDAECDELILLARPRLTRSTVITDSDDKLSQVRTSSGAFLKRGETELVARIEDRIAALLNWPADRGEAMYVLRYNMGEEYKPHYDYFDPKQTDMTKVMANGGQRVGTLVIYLSTPEEGGSTLFNDVKLEVSPIRGNAVFFSYDEPDPMTRTLHAGSPVLRGEKWAVTKWMRKGKFA